MSYPCSQSQCNMTDADSVPELEHFIKHFHFWLFHQIAKGNAQFSKWFSRCGIDGLKVFNIIKHNINQVSFL